MVQNNAVEAESSAPLMDMRQWYSSSQPAGSQRTTDLRGRKPMNKKNHWDAAAAVDCDAEMGC